VSVGGHESRSGGVGWGVTSSEAPAGLEFEEWEQQLGVSFFFAFGVNA